jgi:hypothetical protein
MYRPGRATMQAHRTAIFSYQLSESEITCAEPTFTYHGGPQCRITYHDIGNGTMSWTANVTVAGELVTHASDTSGNINRHDEQVSVGLNTFTARCRSPRSPTSVAFYTPGTFRTAARSRRNGSLALPAISPASVRQLCHLGTGRAARSVVLNRYLNV